MSLTNISTEKLRTIKHFLAISIAGYTEKLCFIANTKKSIIRSWIRGSAKSVKAILDFFTNEIQFKQIGKC